MVRLHIIVRPTFINCKIMEIRAFMKAFSSIVPISFEEMGPTGCLRRWLTKKEINSFEASIAASLGLLPQLQPSATATATHWKVYYYAAINMSHPDTNFFLQVDNISIANRIAQPFILLLWICWCTPSRYGTTVAAICVRLVRIENIEMKRTFLVFPCRLGQLGPPTE